MQTAGTYANADLDGLFEGYAQLYPKVVSRRCDFALECLISDQKTIASNQPEIRDGITFLPGLIETSTYAEPDNILILLPTIYTSQVQQLGDPAWYDSDQKKEIMFYYPGSVPFRPIGTLYEAVVENSWGKFEDLEVYTAEQF